MSRRKCLMIRAKSGRISKSNYSNELLAPAEVRRLVEMAAVGVRDAQWASQCGRLCLSGKISAAQFAASKRLLELTASYSVSCDSPTPPKSAPLEVGSKGHAPDIDSVGGQKQARLHERASLAYIEAKATLRSAGRNVEAALDNIVILDRAPEGLDQLAALQSGLTALSLMWQATSRRKSAAR